MAKKIDYTEVLTTPYSKFAPTPFDPKGLALSDRPTCATCGQPATCIGRYEDMAEDEPACDDCCGHGNEDGHCKPIT